jgi:LysM repeat protein
MPIHLTVKHLGISISALALLSVSPMQSYAIEPKFELNPQVLDKKYAMPPSRAQAKVEPVSPGPRETMLRYKVKPGDDLYKVLSREYGVSGDRAEALVQSIKRLNHLSDIRNLQVGSTIMVPSVAPARAQKMARTKKQPAARSKKTKKTAVRAASSARQAKPSTVARRTDAEVVRDARRVWTQLVPAAPSGGDHFGYLSSAFSLSLDPERYPVLPAQDGGSILVDGMGTLPTLVKSLIQEKNQQVRIVSENPDNRRRFYRSLLNAARFYSFEEDFLVDFGTDPKITVHADFKIEKSPDSLLRQDLILLNVAENRRATPDGLARLLAGNGFRLVDTAAPYRGGRNAAGNRLYQITVKEPEKIADSLLDALAVRFQTRKNIDLYGQEDIGVRLEVPVDRYFEDNGQRFVIALFNGDPVSYTLVRLLETKGYRVIMLQKEDDLHSVTDKMLSRMQIPARFEETDLWPVSDVGYGVRMSGVMIHEYKNGDRNLFVTDRTLDPLVQELAEVNGYSLGVR